MDRNWEEGRDKIMIPGFVKDNVGNPAVFNRGGNRDPRIKIKRAVTNPKVKPEASIKALTNDPP